MDQLLQSVADGKVAPQIATRGPHRVESTRNLRHIPGGKIPEPLAVITRKAMAMEQGDRYQTVKDLQSAVQAFQSEPTPSAVMRRTLVEEMPIAQAPKDFRALVIVLCVIIAALAGVCTKLLLDRSRLEAAQPAKP